MRLDDVHRSFEGLRDDQPEAGGVIHDLIGWTRLVGELETDTTVRLEDDPHVDVGVEATSGLIGS